MSSQGTDIVDLVSFREDLCAELTADVTVCGELCDQNALIVTALAVRSHRRHECTVSSAADAVVDDVRVDALSSFKLIQSRKLESTLT